MNYVKMKTVVPLLVAAIAATVLVGGSQASGTTLACGGSQVCAWEGSSYTGSERYLSCYMGSIPLLFPESRSAKNHCGISQEFGWSEGGSTNWKFCMNSGGERPDPGRFNTERFHSGSC